MAVGEIYATYAAFDVEESGVVNRFVCCFVKLSAEVVHEDATEVAITSVASHVGGRTCPNGLLIELDLVYLEAAEKAGTEMTIAQGEGVFHPRIAYPHGRFGVPKCEGTFGAEGVVAFVCVFVFRKLVAICRISGSRHIFG